MPKHAYFPKGSRGEALGKKLKGLSAEAQKQARSLKGAFGTAYDQFSVFPRAGKRMSEGAASRPTTPPGKRKR